MKKWIVLIMVVSVLIPLVGYSGSTSGDLKDILEEAIEAIDDEVTDIVSDNQLARNLLEGRWTGELIVDFHEGVKGLVLTKNYVHINLEAEFIQFSNNLSELKMVGYMEFMYDTPIVTLYPEGIRQVDFKPNTNHYTGTYEAIVHGVNGPEMYGIPALLRFLDIGKISGGVTVTVKTDTNPTIIQHHTHAPGQGAFYASDLYTLRHLSFITLAPEGPDKVVFGAHASLKPNISGIEENIYGYLERVVILEKEEPIMYGEKIVTSPFEFLKARIENRNFRMELQIEPNTSLEYGKTEEELTKIQELMKIERGKIMIRVRNLTIDQLIRIVLPQAIIGVRGTDLYISVIDDDTSLIKVYEGEIDVEFGNDMYNLGNNQGILILGRENRAEVFEFDSIKDPLRWIE